MHLPPRIIFNWRDNSATKVSQMTRKYSEVVYLAFIPSNVCPIAQLGDKIDLSSGEVRISARHIQDLNLSRRAVLISGLNSMVAYNPVLIKQVIDYHTRGVIPVYRAPAPHAPRASGFPYKKHQSRGIMEKLRIDVRRARILV